MVPYVIMMLHHLDIIVSFDHSVGMRTTLVIDDDLFAVARHLAREKSESIGKALSDLARLGLQATTRAQGKTAGGFPTFSVSKGARTITLEDVKKLEDEA